MTARANETGWHVHHEGQGFPWAHTDAETCYLTDTPRPVLDLADPALRERIARALCRCGAEAVGLDHRHDCPAQFTPIVLAALQERP